jgi:hypothetical protein
MMDLVSPTVSRIYQASLGLPPNPLLVMVVVVKPAQLYITRIKMAGPLSVEDILAKQKAEKEAAARVSLLY